jgi:hypothetical protein
LRFTGLALAALVLTPCPGAAADLCPPASSVRLALCESLIDPTSDRLQARIDSRLDITAPTEDSASPVWMDTRHVTSQPVSLDAPALTTTYFGADYRVGSDVLIGAMVQRNDRATNPLIDGDGTPHPTPTSPARTRPMGRLPTSSSAPGPSGEKPRM